MIGALAIARAFKKNCPRVRMTKDDALELMRLINVAREKWEANAVRQYQKAEKK